MCLPFDAEILFGDVTSLHLVVLLPLNSCFEATSMLISYAGSIVKRCEQIVVLWRCLITSYDMLVHASKLESIITVRSATKIYNYHFHPAKAI